MVELGKRLQDDTLTKEKLLEKCKISNVEESDVLQILEILISCFKIPNMEMAIKYLADIGVILKESVKFYNPDTKKIYGLLVFGRQDVGNGIFRFSSRNPILHELFARYRQLQGAIFILDERLRGLGIDKRMLYYNYNFIQKHDFVWCGVDKDLKTHNYWKRLGFTEFHSDDVARFYMKLF